MFLPHTGDSQLSHATEDIYVWLFLYAVLYHSAVIFLPSSFLSFLIELHSSFLLKQYSPVLLLCAQKEWDLCQPSPCQPSPWSVIHLFPTVHFSNKDNKFVKTLIEFLFLVRKREEIQLEAIFRPLALIICFLTHLKISVLSNIN